MKEFKCQECGKMIEVKEFHTMKHCLGWIKHKQLLDSICECCELGVFRHSKKDCENCWISKEVGKQSNDGGEE